MVQLIVGEKGQGKTKKLIDLANTAVKATDGHIVFIESDSRHMYDLHYDVRFIETANFPLSNYREFVGFLCGILSQDSDIKEVFVDGLAKIVQEIVPADLSKLVVKLDKLSKDNDVKFVISANYKLEETPEDIKPYLI